MQMSQELAGNCGSMHEICIRSSQAKSHCGGIFSSQEALHLAGELLAVDGCWEWKS